MDTSKEKEYLKALGDGDSKAFDLLFLYYQPKLVGFISGFIKDTELARDMAQDIFFHVWTGRQKLSGILSFKSYLYQACRNKICNYYDHLLVSEKYETITRSQPEKGYTHEEEFFAQELQFMIEIAVSQMPPQRKLIYEMSRIQGLTNDEIATRLELNKRTVENHLTLALADIRKITRMFTLLFL